MTHRYAEAVVPVDAVNGVAPPREVHHPGNVRLEVLAIWQVRVGTAHVIGGKLAEDGIGPGRGFMAGAPATDVAAPDDLIPLEGNQVLLRKVHVDPLVGAGRA